MPVDRRFEVGDHVVFRDWDDMAAEYGLDAAGDIPVENHTFFVESMRPLCGRKATITRIVTDPVDSEIVDIELDFDCDWVIVPNMLALSDEAPDVSIDINRDQFLGLLAFDEPDRTRS